MTDISYLNQLEAENNKLRDIIKQMMCVAQAVDDLPAGHQPVHAQQRRPVNIIE